MVGKTIIRLVTAIFIIACINVMNMSSLADAEARGYSNTSFELSRGRTIPASEFIVKEEQIHSELLGIFKVTAYTSGIESCGKNKNDKDYGKTKSGMMAQDGITIASDWQVIKPGTEVYIEGVGNRIVQDAGGAIIGYKIDLYISDLKKAQDFGVKKLKVYIIKE